MLPMAKDPEERQGEQPVDPKEVREAQMVGGEIVWLSTKGRPDLPTPLQGCLVSSPETLVTLWRWPK